MSTRSHTRLALSCAVLGLGALLACRKRHPPDASSSAPASAAADAQPPPLNAAPNATQALHKVGERAQALDYALTIENVKECKTKYYSAPKQGNIRLGVEALFEGLADKEVPVNPFYAKLVDAEGYSYSTTFGGCEPPLNVVRITKGEKAKGWITFELPAKARGLKLSYGPTTFGPKQDLKIDLGR